MQLIFFLHVSVVPHSCTGWSVGQPETHRRTSRQYGKGNWRCKLVRNALQGTSSFPHQFLMHNAILRNLWSEWMPFRYNIDKVKRSPEDRYGSEFIVCVVTSAELISNEKHVYNILKRIHFKQTLTNLSSVDTCFCNLKIGAPVY